MRKLLSILLPLMLACSALFSVAAAEGTGLCGTFVCEMDVNETAARAMHRGLQQQVPCVGISTVTLQEDGTYIFEKVLKSAENEEILCRYTFEGTYAAGKKGRAELNPAEKCTFEENYGIYEGTDSIGVLRNKAGDEQTNPECLEYFSSVYLVYNGNNAAKLKPDQEKGTFAMVDHSEQWESTYYTETAKYIANTYAERDEMRPLGEIVFYGASNFRLWANMEADMAPYSVQNHGMGGSNDLELMACADIALYPFQPSVVFIQTGSNDYTQGATMEEVFANKEKMFGMFHEHLPDTKFIVMAGLPLPGRMEYWDLTVEVNNFLADYCAKYDYMYFVDGTDGILSDTGDEAYAVGDGRYFNPDLFVSDQIHLTQEGHDIWTVYMKEQLAALGL